MLVGARRVVILEVPNDLLILRVYCCSENRISALWK